MNGFWIVWSNSAGEIGRKFAENEDEIASTLIEMLQANPNMSAGDTVTIEEGWSDVL